MSTDPAQALATVERLPPSLQVLRTPFDLDALCASVAQVTERLRTQTIPTSVALRNSALDCLEVSRQVLGQARKRVQRQRERPGGSHAHATDT
jgi:hypothetical protein